MMTRAEDAHPAPTAHGSSFPDFGPARLLGFGECTWPMVRTILDGLTCSWGSNDGWQIGACPSAPPAYTHLWGSTAGALARVRVEGETGIVGVLVPPGSGRWPAVGPAPMFDEKVTVRRLEAFTAPKFVVRVGDRTTIYRVVAARPVDFVVVPSS